MRPFILTNTAYCQFKGCLFVHIGSVAVGVQLSPKWNGHIGLELLTPWRWFGLSPFHRLTWRR